MVIQDEVRVELSGKIVWAVHTSAEPVSVAGSVARFRSGRDRFVLRILEPAAACFEIGFPPEPQVFPIADFYSCTVGRCTMAMLPRWRNCPAASMTKTGAPRVP